MDCTGALRPKLSRREPGYNLLARGLFQCYLPTQHLFRVEPEEEWEEWGEMADSERLKTKSKDKTGVVVVVSSCSEGKRCPHPDSVVE